MVLNLDFDPSLPCNVMWKGTLYRRRPLYGIEVVSMRQTRFIMATPAGYDSSMFMGTSALLRPDFNHEHRRERVELLSVPLQIVCFSHPPLVIYIRSSVAPIGLRVPLA